MFNLYTFLDKFSLETKILLSLAIILLVGFLITRITKLLKLPNVTAYIIAGVLIGPTVFNIIPTDIVNRMGFVSDIALAFIAFGVGKFFKKDVLKQTGMEVIIITIFETVVAFILVTLSMHYIFKIDKDGSWSFSLLIGAIATATAPASTIMTIKQYHAKGHFVNTLLQIVALDDVVCLLIFSVASAVTSSSGDEALTFLDIALPLLYNLGVIVLGFGLGFALNKILSPKRSKDNRLIIIVAMLLGLSGLCGILGISPLLACMVFGATYINVSYDKELYHQLDNFTPPIMTIFFVLSGMKLNIESLKTAGLVGVAYFFIRIVGKYLGAFLGSVVVKEDKALQKYLGFALIPQAGVSIGLAFLAERMLPTELGTILVTIILSSSVLYELIGPVCAKYAIFKTSIVTPIQQTPAVYSTDVPNSGDLTSDSEQSSDEVKAA